jgi:hypothetical protein
MKLLNNLQPEGILLIVVLVIGLIKHFFFSTKTYKHKLLFNVVQIYYSKTLKSNIVYLILLSLLIMFRLDILCLVATLIVVIIINFKFRFVKSKGSS